MRHSTIQVRPWTFFALVYLLSWGIWIPLVLAHWNIGPLRVAEETSGVVRLLGVLMPAVAALLLAAWAGGRAGIGELLRRLGWWRVGWQWWVVAGLAQPALLVLVSLLVDQWRPEPGVRAMPLLSSGMLLVNVAMLTIATLGEEIGWRGLALPLLQARRGALRATLILGVLTALWHVPFWLLLDTFDQYGFTYLALNVLFVLPVTFYVTWFFNHGRGSLLLPVLFHVSFNLVNVAWLPVTLDLAAFALLIAAEWLIALLVLPYLEPDSGRVAQVKWQPS
jgi:uncharacterized protein